MATRNILSSTGDVIGVLELPDDTSDQDWLAALAAYTYVPPVPAPVDLVQASINNAADFGNALITKFAAQNVLAGITQAGKTIAVATYLQTVAYYFRSGSLYAAIIEINNMIADTSDTKTNLSPFVTNTVLYNYLNQVQSYLNIPLTPNPGP